MRNITTVPIYCVLLLLLGGAAGCDPGGGGTGRVDNQDPIPVALPYVEEVHLPAAIHAQQPFAITLDFSSAGNPLALRSPAHPFDAADHWSYSAYNANEVLEYTAVIQPFRDMRRVDSNLPVITSVTYNFDPLPAGICTLRYMSAATREQGGLIVNENGLIPAEMIDGSSNVRTLEFTVLR
jgi:hypothetical protein